MIKIEKAGTVSVRNGSSIVTGHGTAWHGGMFGGGFCCADQSAAILEIAPCRMVLSRPWKGEDMTGAAYEIHYRDDASPMVKAIKDALRGLASKIQVIP